MALERGASRTLNHFLENPWKPGWKIFISIYKIQMCPALTQAQTRCPNPTSEAVALTQPQPQCKVAPALACNARWPAPAP